MRKTLLIAADVDASLRERALEDGRFDVTQTPVRTEDELAAIVGDAQVLVTRAYNKVTRRVIASAPRLELIAQATSGIDNIDAQAARERGIRILNMPGINANAVAELVLGNMIALTRTIPFYTREVVRGTWPREDCATRHELRHFSLGILGLGQVGRIVARLASAFGMQVRAYDPYITDFPNATRVPSLAELLATADILTVHVPLTEETHRMIGAREIAAMPRGAYLVNASRGEVVDQSAALTALADGQLSGLALDVFDPEPPRTIFPDDPRLILTPHVGGCTHEVKSAAGAKLFEQIRTFYA
ncbi:MAG TPA: NAD(P)-dependent oxidoreductase [Thermoanaerobaculia bacterium]|jgi:D-3-phosphoglycerate dehydrogenase|nr:NAD(P)-dependent oxidoreductase [Thermoanaerobaculia bacterium]